jgi:hypothetical protein
MPSSPVSSPQSWSCLAVFNPTLSGGDERRAMDTVLYFYPEDTPDNLKMNHVGLCCAVAGLCETFAETPLETIRTDQGVTALVQPSPDEQVWIAGTVPALYGGHNPIALEIAADHAAAMLRAVLREAYFAFAFRFGSDSFSSRPVVTDFFDRFCRSALPLHAGTNDATALLKSRQPDAIQWLLGMATSHATLTPIEYHVVRSIVASFAARCTSYVLLSEGAVVVSTAGRDVTHACSLLLHVFGNELPSFAAFPADGPGPHWCHVVHCGSSHSFFALCSSSMEDDVARCSAELFMLCDQFKASRIGSPTTLSILSARPRRPQALVSLNFGSRTAFAVEGVKPAMLAALCAPVRALHEQHVPPMEVDTSGGVMMLRRAPMTQAVSRPRSVALDWLDRNNTDLCYLVARDTWIVVRHANRRTIGMLFTDAVSWADIADAVETTTALFFSNSIPFGDAG